MEKTKQAFISQAGFLLNSTAHSKLPTAKSAGCRPALSGISKKGTIPEEWI